MQAFTSLLNHFLVRIRSHIDPMESNFCELRLIFFCFSKLLSFTLGIDLALKFLLSLVSSNFYFQPNESQKKSLANLYEVIENELF